MLHSNKSRPLLFPEMWTFLIMLLFASIWFHNHYWASIMYKIWQHGYWLLSMGFKILQIIFFNPFKDTGLKKKCKLHFLWFLSFHVCLSFLQKYILLFDQYLILSFSLKFSFINHTCLFSLLGHQSRGALENISLPT